MDSLEEARAEIARLNARVTELLVANNDYLEIGRQRGRELVGAYMNLDVARADAAHHAGKRAELEREIAGLTALVNQRTSERDRWFAAFQAEAKGKYPMWEHKKRGSVYVEIGRATLQQSGPYPPMEGSVLVVYRGTDGQLWAREEQEFNDGRFRKAT